MAVNHKDQFGFYRVGAFKTYSKLEAIECMRRTNTHIEWDFQDCQWSLATWQTEPSASLTELYGARARQIRSQYDYVVLMYSGGIDSQNVLDTFVVNNVKIDEVATLNYHKADARPMSYFHAEQTMVSYPYLQTLKDRGVSFLHRSVDLTDITHTLMNRPDLAENYIYYNNVGWGWNRMAKSFIRQECAAWRRIIESGRRLVLVWGLDKPRIYMDQDRLCFKFIDAVIDTAVTGWTQTHGDESDHDELFYWSTDMSEIVIKQAHVIRRFIRQHPDLIDAMQHDPRSNTAYINVNDNTKIPAIAAAWNMQGGMSWRDCICRLIYPYFDADAFNNGKGNGNFGAAIFSARDEIWLQDSMFRKHLIDRLRYLETVDDYWKNNPDNIHDGLKGCISKPYWLEPASKM